MGWQRLPISAFLRKSESWVQPEPDRVYQQIRVRLWGKGLTLRAKVAGANIAAGRQLHASAGQFSHLPNRCAPWSVRHRAGAPGRRVGEQRLPLLGHQRARCHAALFGVVCPNSPLCGAMSASKRGIDQPSETKSRSIHGDGDSDPTSSRPGDDCHQNRRNIKVPGRDETTSISISARIARDVAWCFSRDSRRSTLLTDGRSGSARTTPRGSAPRSKLS